MQHRRAYASVAAVTAAFLIGGATTPATAGAARVTRAKVEAIAAKVVDQKAPTLKVAYAATAGSATKADTATRAGDSTTLAGKAAGDYLTAVRTYDLGSAQPTRDTTINWIFNGLATGSYVLTYDVVLDKSVASSTVTCGLGYVNIGRPIPEQARSQSTTETVVGSVLVTYDGTHAPQLGCSTGGNGTITTRQAQSYSSSAVLTRADVVVPGTLTTQ